MNLLQETAMTTVPIGEASYGLHAQHTIARIILERVQPGVRVTGASIQSVILGLSPWRPVIKQGRFAKRISKYVKETWAMVLPSHTLSVIGNYLAGDLPSDGITYAITKAFDWEQGDFGDRGSCFWTAGNHEMPRLTLSQAYALRFYGSKGQGIGRAIVLPVYGGAMVINCYGHNIFQVARRLKVIDPDTQVTIVPIDPVNRELYINLNQGILVGVPYDAHDGEVPVVFKLPPLPPPPRRRETLYHSLRGCRHCADRGDQVEGIHRIRTLDGTVYLCDECLSVAYDEGFIAYSETTGSYHYQDEMVRERVVIPDETRGRNSFSNVDNVYWRRVDTLLWTGNHRPEDRCSRCGHTCPRLVYASVSRVRITDLCPACVWELGLTSVCPHCASYLHPSDTCFCQPESEANEPAPSRPLVEGELVTLSRAESATILAHFTDALEHGDDEAGDASGVGGVREGGGSPPEEGGDDDEDENPYLDFDPA